LVRAFHNREHAHAADFEYRRSENQERLETILHHFTDRILYWHSLYAWQISHRSVYVYWNGSTRQSLGHESNFNSRCHRRL